MCPPTSLSVSASWLLTSRPGRRPEPLPDTFGSTEGGSTDISSGAARGLASTSAASSESPVAFRGDEPNRSFAALDRGRTARLWAKLPLLALKVSGGRGTAGSFRLLGLLFLQFFLLFGHSVPDGSNAQRGLDPEGLKQPIGASSTQFLEDNLVFPDGLRT